MMGTSGVAAQRNLPTLRDITEDPASVLRALPPYVVEGLRGDGWLTWGRLAILHTMKGEEVGEVLIDCIVALDDDSLDLMAKTLRLTAAGAEHRARAERRRFAAVPAEWLSSVVEKRKRGEREAAIARVFSEGSTPRPVPPAGVGGRPGAPSRQPA